MRQPHINLLMRTNKRSLGDSSIAMNGHDCMPFAPHFVLVLIEAATALGQPFAKCRAFYRFLSYVRVDAM
jgi:hypothetical protein